MDSIPSIQKAKVQYCPRCQETDMGKFYPGNRGKQGAYCIACNLAKNRERYKQQGGKSDERYHQEWARHIQEKFGITEDQYWSLYEKQHGVCAVCKKPETRVNTRTQRPFLLAVDHGHSNKQVRGLLCWHCNMALGLIRENPENIRMLLRYAEDMCV